MKWIAPVAAAAIVCGSATAQAPRTIDDACLRAAEFEVKRDGLVVISSQSFPELSPPRTELVVGEPAAPRSDSGTDNVMQLLDDIMDGRDPSATVHKLGTMRCEFEQPTPPMRLTDYSCSLTFACMRFDKAADARLEELQALLAREGY